MAVKQISVFLENKPGTLAEFAKVISDSNVNLRALNVAESEDFGIVRLIVDDVYEAVTVLKDAGYVAAVKDVLGVSLNDAPGALTKVLTVLGENRVNIEYMYAFTSPRRGSADMIFRVAEKDKAAAVLDAAGIRLIHQEDLA